MGPEDQEHESRAREFIRAVEHPEYERVCTNCRGHWEVPSSFVHGTAHVPSRWTLLDPRSTAEETSSFDSAERQYDTCPGCGAYKSFTEHRLLLESREQD